MTPQLKHTIAQSLLIIGCILIAVMMITATISNTIVITEIRNAQRNSRAAVDAIKDCTTPGRKCFTRSQRQTGKVVGSLNDMTVIAAACADRPNSQTLMQIKRCIVKEINRPARQRR